MIRFFIRMWRYCWKDQSKLEKDMDDIAWAWTMAWMVMGFCIGCFVGWTVRASIIIYT